MDEEGREAQTDWGIVRENAHLRSGSMGLVRASASPVMAAEGVRRLAVVARRLWIGHTHSLERVASLVLALRLR